MKSKKIKKLSLTKETIARLDNKDLKKVQGGYTLYPCLTRDKIETCLLGGATCRFACTGECP
jgi:natural product precursor